ncbi:MAG: peptidylprolyl isomerase, partial [Prevotella sp.]|nr:peptidylprolyl isomerase [Prevotella sp.]
NEYQNVALTQGNMIIQVTDRRSVTPKYNVAVIKKTIDFSDETSNNIYNKFNSFVAANRTLADMEKNAKKSGYEIKDMQNVTTSSGVIAGIQGTRDALKWVFEAKEGEISPVYSCGANTDELLVCVLTKVHPKGYLTLEHEQVKEYVKAEAMNDKKAEMIMAKMKGVNSIAAAKQKGCKVTTVEQITFAAPAMIAELQASEPTLSGAVFATPKGKFSTHPVKGNAGVYLFQVTDKKQLPGKFDAKQYAEQVAMQNMRTMFQTIQSDMQRKADVEDNRYLFM